MFSFVKPDIKKLEEKRNVKGLIKALKYKGDAYIRWKAAKILGKWKEERAIKGLVELLNDPDWHVRRNAVEALGNIGNKICVKEVEKLLDDKNPYVRAESATALGKIKDINSVEVLTRHLSDTHLEVKIRIIEAIGEIGDIRGLEPLIDILKKGRDNRIEGFVGEALGKIGKNPVAKEALINVLKYTTYPNIKWAISKAFFDIKDKKVVDYLIKLLKEIDPFVRAQAIATLGEIRDEKAFPYIVEALKDFAWEVRKEAAEALIKMKNKEAITPLKEALEKETSEDVEATIRKAITYLSNLNIEQNKNKK